jgi:uncharacterized protein (TIGR00369 family)
MNDRERPGAIDGLSDFIGMRWDDYDKVRVTVRDELINPAGLLSGAVTYAMVDYCMGSTLWKDRASGERIATIGISINYIQTAREGDVVCTSRGDRRNDRVAVLSSEVRDEDDRLLATAIGSYSIFPKERLGGHERRPAAPADVQTED